MTDRLLELAEKAGVETARYDESCQPGSKLARPRLDIAHELLAKMHDKDCGFAWYGSDKWGSWTKGDTRDTRGPFEECVVALAERWVK